MMQHKLFGYGTFLLLLLGMLSAFGPFVTDMYLPALPSLQASFSAEASMVQLSLSTSMLGLAVGQVFFGPLSDMYGRRPIIIASLWLFLISTIGCIFVPTIEYFVLLRFFQGVGGAGGIVLSRSVATDRYWGEKLVKMMAVIGAINGVAPVVAPVVGGMMTDSVGWRGIFVVLFFLGVLLLMSSFFMRESLPREKRSEEGLIRTFASFGRLFRNQRFVWLLLQYGATGGVFFAYIASSPFIIQEHYGSSAFTYSVIFGVNALFIGVAAAASVRFRTPERSTHVGSVGMAIASLLMFFAVLFDASFVVYETLTIALVCFIGLCFTSTVSMAMNEGHENAGAASALIGALMFAFGGIVSPLVGIGNILIPMAIVSVVCSILALAFDILSRSDKD